MKRASVLVLALLAACTSIDTGREIQLYMEYGYVQPADFMWWKVGVAPIEDARQEPGLIGYLHDNKGQPIRSVHPQEPIDQWFTKCLITELRRISVQPETAKTSGSDLVVTGRIIDFEVGTSIDQPTVYQGRIRLRILVMRAGEVIHRFEYSDRGTTNSSPNEVARPFEELVTTMVRRVMRAAAKDIQEFVSRN